jgi:hypothetical protein
MDQGSELIPDLVFRAEGREVLAEARRLDRRGEAGAIAELRIPLGGGFAWDHLAVAVGTVEVDGGSPAEWLDRVHRDPSLQPMDFAVEVSASFPESARERIEGVQLQLFRPGSTEVRAERMLRPGDPPWNLQVSLGLADLAASAGGALPAFVLEHFTLYRDLGPGLPQRSLVDLNANSMVVRALAETSTSRYTVVRGAERETGRTRAQVEETLAAMRSAGQVWQLFVERAADAPPPAP